jgi:hypothetical protein
VALQRQLIWCGHNNSQLWQTGFIKLLTLNRLLAAAAAAAAALTHHSAMSRNGGSLQLSATGGGSGHSAVLPVQVALVAVLHVVPEGL